jgi:hypothetical protein
VEARVLERVRHFDNGLAQILHLLGRRYLAL